LLPPRKIPFTHGDISRQSSHYLVELSIYISSRNTLNHFLRIRSEALAFAAGVTDRTRPAGVLSDATNLNTVDGAKGIAGR
jgi:hypothetical protein